MEVVRQPLPSINSTLVGELLRKCLRAHDLLVDLMRPDCRDRGRVLDELHGVFRDLEELVDGEEA